MEFIQLLFFPFQNHIIFTNEHEEGWWKMVWEECILKCVHICILHIYTYYLFVVQYAVHAVQYASHLADFKHTDDTVDLT